MTNSLIELYGGGMVGKSNNYQLGGRIASAKRGREYQKEMRQLKEKAEAAERRKKESGFLGALGSLAGGTIGSIFGPAGTAVGAAWGRRIGEGTYEEEDYGSGKYAKETREDLREAEQDYRRGMTERALVTGLQAGIMPGFYEKAGSWLKGLGGAKEAATAAADIAGAVPEFAPAAPVHEGMAASGLQLPGMPELGATPSMAMEGFGSRMASKLSAMPSTAVAAAPSLGFEDAFREARNLGLDEFMWQGNPYHTRLVIGRGGGWIPKMQTGGMALPEGMMNPTMGANLRRPNRPPIGMPSAPSPVPPRGREGIVPKPEGFPTPTSPIGRPMAPTAGANLGQIDSVAGQDLTPDLSGTDFSALQGLSGGDIVFGGNPVFKRDTDWSMTGSNLFGLKGAGAQVTSPTTTSPTTTSPTGSTTLSAPIGGYGSAIGAVTALSQMGMGDVATDPRLQEYLEDLPQFSQGYRQQFGDIQRSGRQALQQLYAAQRLGGGAAGGFAGAGAGGQAFQQQLGGLRSDIGRQRRGVVEGFQSDLLSAIRDIEAKGEFEFGTSGGFDPVADIMAKNPSLTIEEAEELHSQNVDAYYDQQYG